MIRTIGWTRVLLMLVCVLLGPQIICADVPGVAPGIPEPEHRNVIVQLFNWRFKDIEGVLPRLKELGYSHVHVSPPQKSNEQIWQWWGRYQPIDFSVISGPLGSEQEFKEMNDVAHQHDMQIIVDVVFNHTIDIKEMPYFVVIKNDRVVKEEFPQFEPHHFHIRCDISESDDNSAQKCWLSSNLVDLKTEDADVREIARQYLIKLVGLGADGFRFDAAKHIEPDFFPAVLAAVPDTYAFGEIIEGSPNEMATHVQISEMDYYDFPLVAAMRETFQFGGDLSRLKDVQQHGQALAGTKAITFVRNHDIDRGQAFDRGLEDGGRHTFGVGWDEGQRTLNRTDVTLAYAFIFGREPGFPYVFVDMPTLPQDLQDDRFDDPDIVSGIRFHNLCLANPDGSSARPEIWRVETPHTIGWQRGTDRFIVINKAAEWYEIRNLTTSLQQGTYKDVRNGWPMHVQADGTIREWNVPPRSAMMFVRVGD